MNFQKKEQYLAFEHPGMRYDIGSKYGLFTAQIALALNGKDRDLVLTKMLELLAQKELSYFNKSDEWRRGRCLGRAGMPRLYSYSVGLNSVVRVDTRGYKHFIPNGILGRSD